MKKTVDLIERLNGNEVALYLDENGLMHATRKRTQKDTQSAKYL